MEAEGRRERVREVRPQEGQREVGEVDQAEEAPGQAEPETEAEPETDGREGLRSLELLIASYLSARDGRRVALPLEY